MDARTLDEAASELARKRLRALETVALAIASGGLAAPAWIYASAALGAALAAGAAVEALLALGAVISRRTQLEDLALDPAAYVIPEVSAFGARLARPRGREQLAKGIRSLLHDVLRPGNLFLADRVVDHARELEAIARDLLSPAVRAQPAAVALCRRLLTRAAESPLYNPSLPAEDLASWLRRIQAGMQRPAAQR